MRKVHSLLLVGWLLAGAGCALAGAPAWVRKGHLDCELAPCPDVLSAVGSSGSNGAIRNDSLRRTTAETDARNALARIVAARLASGGTDSFRSFVAQNVTGVEIVDHWIARNGTEFALAELTQSSLRQAIEQRTDLKPEDRETLEKQAAILFGGR